MKKDCPKKIGIHRLNVPAIAPLRYIMATMNGKPVRAILDGCASCSAIWAPLVPPPPKDALRYASSGVHFDGEHSLTSMSQLEARLTRYQLLSLMMQMSIFL